jgi:nucleoside-diphosphate-sugar epimerase
MKGGWPAHQCATVQGTRNVVEACLGHGVGKLVHTSSLSVVHWADGPDFAIVDEDVGLEPRADERGAYTRSKLEAERIVAAAVVERNLPAVILRPGQIFGGKLPLLTAAVARRVPGARWLVLGDGKIPLPLVYLDDVVDALVLAARAELRGGEVIQLVDPESLNQNEVLELAAPGEPVVRVPRGVVFAGGKLSELALGAFGKRSPLSEYRLRSALALRRFESGRAERLLGWRPRVGVREGIRRVAERQAA